MLFGMMKLLFHECSGNINIYCLRKFSGNIIFRWGINLHIPSPSCNKCISFAHRIISIILVKATNRLLNDFFFICNWMFHQTQVQVFSSTHV